METGCWDKCLFSWFLVGQTSFRCLELLHTPAGLPLPAHPGCFFFSLQAALCLSSSHERSLSPVRLAPSLLPSVFDMWRSVDLSATLLAANQELFPQSLSLHERVLLIAGPSFQMVAHLLLFCALQRIAPSSTFARSCGIQGDSKQRPCISGVHSCRHTCDTSKPPRVSPPISFPRVPPPS